MAATCSEEAMEGWQLKNEQKSAQILFKHSHLKFSCDQGSFKFPHSSTHKVMGVYSGRMRISRRKIFCSSTRFCCCDFRRQHALKSCWPTTLVSFVATVTDLCHLSLFFEVHVIWTDHNLQNHSSSTVVRLNVCHALAAPTKKMMKEEHG